MNIFDKPHGNGEMRLSNGDWICGKFSVIPFKQNYIFFNKPCFQGWT